MKKSIYIFIAISLVLTSCLKTEFDEIELKSGSANFSNYIAVGNSLTQGFQDNGLHNDNNEQDNSYPAILAKQMKLVAPEMGSFVQPTVNEYGSGYVYLGIVNGELSPIKPGDPGGRQEDGSWSSWGNKTLKYNNLGVAGVRLADCVPTAGDALSSTINQFVLSANPYGRFLDFGTTFINEVSYLDHIKNSDATFFTCWLGNNDVLGWATSGGDDGEINILGTSIKTTGLTDVNEFRNKYDSVLVAFNNMGAKGICATIPDVTAIPYFTTITPAFVGVSELWITEGDGSTVRKLTSEDLVILTASDAIESGKGLTQGNPLDHTEVLDRDEVQMARNHTIALNNEIKASAAVHGYYVVDMYDYMGQLSSGLVYDGVELTAKFIEGGVFSLDGVHPNQRGYAVVANKFIETINQSYGSNIPPVDIGNYKSVVFPD